MRNITEAQEVALWNELYQRIAEATHGMELPVDVLIGVFATFIGGAIDAHPDPKGRERLRRLFLDFVEKDLQQRDMDKAQH